MIVGGKQGEKVSTFGPNGTLIDRPGTIQDFGYLLRARLPQSASPAEDSWRPLAVVAVNADLLMSDLDVTVLANQIRIQEMPLMIIGHPLYLQSLAYGLLVTSQAGPHTRGVRRSWQRVAALAG